MSRYGDEGDGADYNNAGDLWAKAYELALRGKRGRQALQELRDALMALPEHKLIARALCTVGGERRVLKEVPDDKLTRPEWVEQDRGHLRELIQEVGEGVCAVGAYVWWQKVKAGMDPTEAFETLPTLDDINHDISETAHEAKELGMAGVLAWNIAYRNDEQYQHLTPEQRWSAFVAWIDQQLALPPLTRPAPKPKKRPRGPHRRIAYVPLTGEQLSLV